MAADQQNFDTLIHTLGTLATGLSQVVPSNASPAAPSATSRAPEERNYIAKPDAYNGDKAHYESFRQSVCLYVAAISSQRGKILATLSYLTQGDANVWARSYFTNHQDALAANTVVWTTFLEELDARFKDPRLAADARQKFLHFKMGNTDARTFFIEVDELRDVAGYAKSTQHDDHVVDTLERNMPADLVLAIHTAHESYKSTTLATIAGLKALGLNIDADVADAQRDELNKPISYEMFREYALHHDEHVRRARKKGNTKAESQPTRPKQSFPTNRPYGNPIASLTMPTTFSVASSATEDTPKPAPTVWNRPTPAAPAKEREPDVIPMDIDRTNVPNKACWTCGQHGHYSAQCPRRAVRVHTLGPDELRQLADEMENAREPTDPASDVEQDF
ncbi:hypothetical protein EXIGLDRAFT_701017 [Exidia glandulosa HHB12029]|uniref:CCHC-type domain-containing protein n=1 Tax=Exidia glandulosa HHB12029 TaxID=1314781 RepID=A0A165LYL6_EXIGL|nr:hypothetical protein EXIGLDRAFT_701017 [Exidia glandulosa HHB12029]